MVLIVSVLVVYRQMNFVHTKNLGYDRDNLLYFLREGNLFQNDDAFIAEIENIAGVKSPYNKTDGFRLFAVWATLRGYPLPDWPELSGTPVRRIKGRFEELRKDRVIRESYPDWLDERCLNELGTKRWEKECVALNEEAHLILRTNTLKCRREELLDLFKKEEIEAVALQEVPEGILLPKRLNVFKLDAFKQGFFEVFLCSFVSTFFQQ